MKKTILLITGLFLLFSVEGQILRYSNYTAPAPSDTTNYYSVYKAIYDEMATPPGHDTAHFQSNLVYSLDTMDFAGGSSVWDRIDLLYIMAGRDSTDAKINWANPGTFNLTNPGNAITFTKYQGFNGVGAAYLKTGYVPDEDSINVSRASITIASWQLTDRDVFNITVGCYGTTHFYIVPRQSASKMSAAISNTTASDFSDPVSTIGFSMATRRGATEVEGYMNGSSLGSDNDASSVLADLELYVCGLNLTNTLYGGWNGPVSIVLIMDAVTDAEADAIYDVFHTYMTAIGQ